MQIPAAYLGRLFEIADSLTAPQRMDAGQAAIDLLVRFGTSSPRHLAARAPRAYC
jgi:hypothetical protein